MAGSSIQEVTKDEWGPPADREQTEGEIASYPFAFNLSQHLGLFQ